MKSNPKKAVQAVINPAPLTLAQIALFERIDAPFLYGDFNNIEENGVALWIYRTPLEQVVHNWDERELLSLQMLTSMTLEEFILAVRDLSLALTRFQDMMPKPEPPQVDPVTGEIKKKAHDLAMAGLLKSQSSPAEPTATHWIWRCVKYLRLTWLFSGGVMRRE